MRNLAALLTVMLLIGPGSAAGASDPGRAGATAPPRDAAQSSVPGAVQGVVLAHSGSVLTLLARGNVLLSVIIAGTTAVSGGRRSRASREEAGLARGSIVEVAGPRNSDGSLSAHTVGLLFDARQASRAGGRIIRPTQEGGFLLSDGTVVVLAEDPWVFRGTTLLSPGTLASGAAVILYGTSRGGRFLARVIEASI